MSASRDSRLRRWRAGARKQKGGGGGGLGLSPYHRSPLALAARMGAAADTPSPPARFALPRDGDEEEDEGEGEGGEGNDGGEAPTAAEPPQAPGRPGAGSGRERSAALDRAALRAAAAGGDTGRVRELLAGAPGADRKLLGAALHVSAAAGHAAVVRELLRQGADPDAVNMAGNTPTHRAAQHGHAGVLEELFAAACSLNVRNEDGKCAVAVAATAPVRAMIAAEAKARMPGGVRRCVGAGGSCGHAACDPGEKENRGGPEARTPTGGKPAAAPGDAQHKARPSPSPSPSPSVPEEFICRICLREYCSEAGTSPVCLPCGHTFCADCISTLQGTKGHYEVKTSFRCPLDRQVFSRNLQLKANETLQSLIHQYRDLVTAAKRPGGARASPRAALVDCATSPLALTPNGGDAGAGA